MRVKPILFNTEMVRAIMEGRKTATRRGIKQDVSGMLNSPYHKEHPEVPDKTLIQKLCKPPCQTGDTLYVRETWCENINLQEYYYAADRRPGARAPYGLKWHPSIHMPRAAARIWLRVRSVKAERIQEMTLDDFLSEGVVIRSEAFNDPENAYMQARDEFIRIWDSTVPGGQQDLYSWEANPWEWAIEFERCGKPEEHF